MVYLQDTLFYLVKIGIRTSLDREFRGLSIAHAAIPRHVPRPLGLTSQASSQVLVTEGIRHEHLVLRAGQDGIPVFERGMSAFLAASLSHFQAPHSDFGVNVHDALSEASEVIDWSAWRLYLDHVGPLIERLPRIMQHGDLAVNNIAVADGELVFFDWEEFGLVDLLGFDLAVALLSLHDFDAAQLRERLATSTMEAGLVKRCCLLHMSTDLFLDLFPAYLSLFIKVKRSRGYGPAVAARAVAALRDWVNAKSTRIVAE